jgi:tRNA dimethylallyltransferase
VAPAAPRLIAIVGPTASGKSALALSLAELVPAEIVSCDSVQVYRGFDVGSAKATAEERARVPHHLLDLAPPDGDFSAADYARIARGAIGEISRRGRLPLLVGGTGLYFRALFRGLFEGPPRDDALRARLTALAERHGVARLHRLLRRRDPAAAARIASRDLVRIVRALEVVYWTGRPISEHHRDPPQPLLGYHSLFLGLDPGREGLRQAIAARTRRMLAAGLLAEVQRLVERHGPSLRPLRAVGYRQAVDVLAGRLPAADLEPEIVKETLRFAKRQRTWFRKEPGIQWLEDPRQGLQAARDWLGAAPTSL